MTKTESVVTLKNDFLTIPDAPDYEINSELILRNKSTGKILKPQVKKGVPYYFVRTDKKPLYRTANSFRRQAVAAANPYDSSRWLPVPSLGGKYELNNRGLLRNSVTKRILTKIVHNRFIGFHIRSDDKKSFVTLKNLMWEVYGVVPQSLNSPVSCSVFKNGVFKKFDSLRDCAVFLAGFIYLSSETIENYLGKRCTEFYGWKIKYAPRDFWSADKEAVSKKILRGVGK